MLAVLIAGAGAGILSAPHCALMCGPIASYSARGGPSASVRYHLGRSLSYASAGAIAALLGQPVIGVLWNSNATVALSWTLALLMAMAAYRAWPRSRAAPSNHDASRVDESTSAPSSLTSSRETLVQIRPRPTRAAEGPKSTSWVLKLLRLFPRQPLVLGAFSVLIPCATLWGGLVIAASSGSPLAGAGAMAAFSLTSGSGLLASTLLTGRLGKGANHRRLLSFVFALGAIAFVIRPIAMAEGRADSQGAHETAPVHCPLHGGAAL